MTPDFSALQFLRPLWLWALLALPLLVGWWLRRQRRASVWRTAVDPHLLPRLLDSQGERRGSIALAIGAFGYLLTVLALAGPSWRQSEQPLWQSRTPLVVALDLSGASLAGDLPPSRLAQARAKLATLLARREGGQVGLVAYAGDAFTVAPLTDDAANVALFLDALHPGVMPVDGQRSDRAIEWSVKLLQQAGFDRGQLLLLTDHADADAREAAASARAQGYRVSALGLGTAQGALYKQPDGTIANARLDADSLRQLASAGGGSYAGLDRDASDLQSLGVLAPTDAASGTAQGETGRIWHDEGYWLLPPLMLLALLAFRRGAAVVLVLVVLWLPGRSVHAAELWQRPDQVAHAQMQQAAQAYREGEFDRAAQLYGELDGANAHYNRGNALARAGDYPEAIDAYEQALQQAPGMEDAIANKRAVEAAMKRQPSGGQQEKQDPREGEQQGSPQDPQQGEGQQQQGEGDPSQEPPQKPQDPASDSKATPPEPPEPTSAEAQQSADQAQRQRMQQALQAAREDGGDDDPVEAAPAETETAEQRERRIANEAWLQRIPDDPGGLLREKFRLEYQRRRMQGGWEE